MNANPELDMVNIEEEMKKSYLEYSMSVMLVRLFGDPVCTIFCDSFEDLD